MDKRELFIRDVENLKEQLSKEAKEYFEEFKNKRETSLTGLTKNGTKILKYMQDNYESVNNHFLATDIGTGLSTSGRSVSGSLRKLISDGYVEKLSEKPIAYSLTDLGKTFMVDN